MMTDPFARSGHLTDLALESMVLDALPWPARWRAAWHLTGCPVCRARHEAVGGSASPAWRWAPLAAGGVALAATLAVRGLPTPSGPPPDFAAKGPADVDLEVWVHDGERARPLAEGGSVRRGDRLGFRVATPNDGFAMLFATDAHGDWTQVFPATATVAQPIHPDESELLSVAVRLDDSEGSEWFHAVVCEHSFDADEAKDRIARRSEQSDCSVVSREVARGTGP